MKETIDKLFKGIEILIAIFLIAMIALMFMNVVLRYFFSKGFAWSEEIARICFIYLVYLGSIEAAKDNRHLLIDSLLLKFKPATQKYVYALIQLCIIYLMGVLTVGSWGLMKLNLHDRWVATHFPIYLVYLSGFILGISIILVSLANLVHLFVQKRSVSELIAVPAEEKDDLSASAE
ncbi:MAG: TRAP transporter small permease [Sphaerochaeta sp.]|jgi:TRAP-type C4-dicarboxylate transport system permease small subunit|uniref:TRAP transporter small permease n=1 Tax=Sphaerochaeta sp. TaxID=1972642 RepID=UPI002FC5E182